MKRTSTRLKKSVKGSKATSNQASIQKSKKSDFGPTSTKSAAATPKGRVGADSSNSTKTLKTCPKYPRRTKNKQVDVDGLHVPKIPFGTKGFTKLPPHVQRTISQLTKLNGADGDLAVQTAMQHIIIPRFSYPGILHKTTTASTASSPPSSETRTKAGTPIRVTPEKRHETSIMDTTTTSPASETSPVLAFVEETVDRESSFSGTPLSLQQIGVNQESHKLHPGHQVVAAQQQPSRRTISPLDYFGHEYINNDDTRAANVCGMHNDIINNNDGNNVDWWQPQVVQEQPLLMGGCKFTRIAGHTTTTDDDDLQPLNLALSPQELLPTFDALQDAFGTPAHHHQQHHHHRPPGAPTKDNTDGPVAVAPLFLNSSSIPSNSNSFDDSFANKILNDDTTSFWV